MKTSCRFLTAAAPMALVLAFSIAASAAPAKYGSYLSALGQLRSARAYIEHPDSGELHQQEKDALAEIDAAIGELKSVADEGKSANEHPSIDSHLRWIPRLNKAADLLNKAHDNVAKESDGSGAKDRAIDHIAKAHKLVEQAIALEQ